MQLKHIVTLAIRCYRNKKILLKGCSFGVNLINFDWEWELGMTLLAVLAD